MFPDSKTIVDMPLKAPPGEVAAAFAALSLPSDPQQRSASLAAFVQEVNGAARRGGWLCAGGAWGKGLRGGGGPGCLLRGSNTSALLLRRTCPQLLPTGSNTMADALTSLPHTDPPRSPPARPSVAGTRWVRHD